jgi:hypothetical protein
MIMSSIITTLTAFSMLATAPVIDTDISPLIGVAVLIIKCITLVVILVLLKRFIGFGISVTVAEFLIKNIKDTKWIRTVTTWLVNEEDILACLDSIREKVGGKEPKKKE